MIGVFDSGYGGLSILKDLRSVLPTTDFYYLGDNARSPYGSRSFDTVYRYTLQGVKQLFDFGCPLVILACNTSSARALRTIQQKVLPELAPQNRVLGVLRPAVEQVGHFTKTKSIGILATEGTIKSKSYEIEMNKFFPEITVTSLACPMLVPLVENGEWDGGGAQYYIEKYANQLLSRNPDIDTVLLGCTHYPILLAMMKDVFPSYVRLVTQGDLVAPSLMDYLERHPDMNQRISHDSKTHFATSEDPETFRGTAEMIYGPVGAVKAIHW
jgi:glutamate racemase